ncbi:MAG: hypothetical protein WC538_04595 [Thermoanaerobaculia bacterium]|jgi:uncharacterized repeat protein (TIGR01451 family)
MKRISYAAAFCLITLMLPVGAAAQNLVTNPDFESGLTGWTVWTAPPNGFWLGSWIHSNDCDIWVPTTCPYGGSGISHAQKKGSGGGNTHGGLYQQIAVQAGRQYRVSGVWSGGVTGNIAGNNGTWWEVVVYDGAVTDAVIDQAPGPQDAPIAKREANNLANNGVFQFDWEPFSGIFTAQSGTVTLALKTGSYFTYDAAGYHDNIALQLLSQPVAGATKSAALQNDADGSGGPGPGDTIRYTVLVTNAVDPDALDITGALFTDTPGANTTLVAGSVTTSTGTVTTGNTPGDTTVAIDLGTLTDGQTATITFDVTIANFPPGSVPSVSNQGLVTADNIAQTPTDDPATAAAGDPTVFAMQSGAAVPSIEFVGLLLLAISLALIAVTRLRMS